MSAPVPLGYLDSGDYTEREKDRTQNKIIREPGEACAEERQGAEQNKGERLGVHIRSRLERGSDQAAPPAWARVDGLEPTKTSSPRAAGRRPAAEGRSSWLCPVSTSLVVASAPLERKR